MRKDTMCFCIILLEEWVVIFVVGQRWVSAAEPELGLGLVVDAATRQVAVLFPASGERRTYATGGAPLSRVQFESGDQIVTDDGAQLTVLQRLVHDERFVYLAEDAAGAREQVDELDLAGEMQLSRPRERLFAGHLDTPEGFSLRARTLVARHRQQASPVAGLLGPRVALLPHQLFIASEVGHRHAPRVLLADEVGLGKTVEAGLVLHQKLLRGECERALVVVPESLLHQWLVEMLRRFNLLFSILDASRLDEHEGGGNVFHTQQLWLCPLELLLTRSDAHARALEGQWDMLVVDEAHHLHFHDDAPSPAYRAVDALAARVPAVLLLTATPSRLGTFGHFARLRLLDPARFADAHRFEAEQAGYLRIGPLADRLNGLAEEGDPDLAEVDGVCAALAPLLGEAAVAELRRAAQTSGWGMTARMSLQELLDRHGTGRVLFRNTRAVVGGFAPRRLQPHPLPAPEGWSPQGPEAALTPELTLGAQWIAADPRVAWLVGWLGRNPEQKALLICARDDTARSLEQHLRVRVGVRACVFHGGMDLMARDRAAAWFAELDGGAQILICSEIGSEGRNFQHAHHLLMFDLPTSLELLEQRIGRLDRIGQSGIVNIHVPFYAGSAQEVLLRWLHEGLDALQAPFPAPQRAHAELDEPLRHCLQQPGDADAIEQLLRHSQGWCAEVRAELERGRDRLLELNSFHPVRGHDLRSEILEASPGDALKDLLEPLLDRLGVDMEPQDARRVVIRPGDHMQVGSLPGLPEEGLSGTWDRAFALVHEDTAFLTWEHPMVRAAMAWLLDSGFGNASLGRLSLSALAPGTLVVEALYALHCPAPASLGLARHVPDPLLRVVVDSAGRDLGAALPQQTLDRLIQPLPADTGLQVLARARGRIQDCLSAADSLAHARAEPLVQRALERAASERGAEIARLQALAKVNSGVREVELQALCRERDEALARLAGMAPLVDALRVSVVA
jgi:ATP-dependent helicase HepA